MNKVQQSKANPTIPEGRKRRFIAGVERRAKKRAFAKAQAKRRRKAGR